MSESAWCFALTCPDNDGVLVNLVRFIGDYWEDQAMLCPHEFFSRSARYFSWQSSMMRRTDVQMYFSSICVLKVGDYLGRRRALKGGEGGVREGIGRVKGKAGIVYFSHVLAA